jgi:hypothetical protein
MATHIRLYDVCLDDRSVDLHDYCVNVAIPQFRALQATGRTDQPVREGGRYALEIAGRRLRRLDRRDWGNKQTLVARLVG